MTKIPYSEYLIRGMSLCGAMCCFGGSFKGMLQPVAELPIECAFLTLYEGRLIRRLRTDYEV